MKKDTSVPKTVDAYIASYPSHIQKKLKEIRRAIAQTAPQATEKISYGIPTFVLGKNLVHFGGYETHIGFYPGSSGVRKFQDKLSTYTYSKGTIQFPLDKPLPIELIKKIVEFRVKENTR